MTLVSPERKRAKLLEYDLSDDEEKMHDANESDLHDLQAGEAVTFTKELEKKLLDLHSQVQNIEKDVSMMKPELYEVNRAIQAAQCEAEEANENAGLAHAASEEAANISTELKIKSLEIQAAMMKRQDVEEVMQAAMVKMKEVEATYEPRRKYHQSSEQSDKFSRTIVIGGFEQDSMKADVEKHIADMVKGQTGYEDHYAYRRGSIGFVRFQSVDDMWSYLKKVNAKGRERPVYGSNTLWVSASRSPEDRTKRKALNTAKHVLIEVGLAKEEETEYDPKRGLLWIGRQRVAEWLADSGRLSWNSDALMRAGVDVDGKSLSDAINEKMQTTK